MTNGISLGAHGHHGTGGTTPDFHDDMHGFLIPLKPGDPGPAALKNIKRPKVATYIAKHHGTVRLRNARNPSPQGSFGYIGRFLRIDIEGDHFHPGTVVISFNPRRIGSVAIETLRIFQWMDYQKKYRLIHHSGVGQTRNYVWGKIEEPGIYAVIGVNADPLVARTLGILHYLHGWSHTGGTIAQSNLHRRICKLLLSNAETQNLLSDPAFARKLVEENLRHGLPGKWPGGIPPKKTKQQWQELEAICVSPNFPHEPPEAQLLEMSVLTPAEGGEWVVIPQSSEVLAIHAALLKTGKVLYFSGSEHDKKQHKKKKVDHTRLWDPATGNVQTIGSPTHDTFCVGHSFLADGKLLAAGGTQKYGPGYKGLRETSIFDPDIIPPQNPWITASMMHFQRGTTKGGGRWYPTLVTLANGDVLTVSGFPEKTDTRPINIMVEIFNTAPAPQGSYTDIGDQPTMPKGYPRMYLLPDGMVYCSTDVNNKTMKLDCSDNTKSNLPGPGKEFDNFATTAVLLPLLPANNHAPRVLLVGASQPQIIDLSAGNPVWQDTSPRALSGSPARKNGNAVLLPDGTVLAVGGSETKLDADAVLAAERYDPATGAWSVLANSAVPRLYHSVALLLPDGRVWTSGSNFDCEGGLANRELRIELYSPPYLFQGPRPTITSAPATVTPQAATTFSVQTPQANDIAKACLIRCGSVTHGFDADQRYVGLTIQSHTASQLTVVAPPNKNVAPPGYYLLFVVDNDGIPSIGKFVRIQ